MAPAQILEQAIRLHQSGRSEEAERTCAQLLITDPDNPEALQLHGLLLATLGRVAQAIIPFARVATLHPDRFDLQFNLGKALRDCGRFDESIAAYRRAIELQPEFPAAHNNLGNALKAADRLNDAADAYRRAIAVKPDYAEAFFNLGTVLQHLDDFESAADSYRRAISFRPNYPQAFNNLGIALRSLDRLDEAVDAYRRAVELKPDFADALSNLGSALRDSGRVAEAIRCFRNAVRVSADPRMAHNLLATLHFDPSIGPGQILETHLQWARQYAHLATSQPHDNDRSPARRLRIGYVSPDFRDHPVGRFILPLLSHHNRGEFEIFCYSDFDSSDAITQRLKNHADCWRETKKLSDENLANLIREDRIDILIDLTLHFDGNRLLVFARKPAPVQITYLAYCSTSGLATMDYRITDRFLDPIPADEAEARAYDRARYCETSLVLPNSYWCYQPPAHSPDVGPLPALSIGHITFGCLNNFAKVSPPALALWSRLLTALPQSRIHIASPRGSHRDRLHAQFRAVGVSPDRVQFIDRMNIDQYFAAYHAIDIALDPFPYNGGTTTCDALWMGVPVVSLTGSTAVSRAGASILANLGMLHLAADLPNQFVTAAVNLARDLPALANQRATLRQQMIDSPLMDAPSFAKDMKALYRRAWTQWCAN